MREAPRIERRVGMAYYASDAAGIGGRLRDRPAEFRVRELEAVDPAPVDADPGDYPHLLVRATLAGWDTNDFAGRLSDALGISRERVAWAGTKDKHAVTTQLFTVRGIEAGSLPAVRDADVEVVGRLGRSLRFGDLAGNAFEITVRDPERPDRVDAVTADLRAFARGGGDPTDDGCGGDDANGTADVDGPVRIGVPNYFGQQRFGSLRPVTHEVGLRILRRDPLGAVLAYAGNPHEAEPSDTREGRAAVEELAAGDDPDWRAAVGALPRRLGHERAMLQRLAETGDPWAALSAVPSNLQRLFVNAAQSYAFNRIVSGRLRRGLPFDRPVEGDVVCFADQETTVEGRAVPDPDRSQRVTAGRVDAVTRHCERGRAFVTAPLVGTETALAEGAPGDIERAVLADLDLTPAEFDLPGEFASRGTRRAILLRADIAVSGDPPRFEFALPSGAYATTVLREYRKTAGE